MSGAYEMIRKVIVVIGMLVLAACGADEPTTRQTAAKHASAAADPARQVNSLADELLAHLRETSASVRMQSGLAVTELDDITPEYVQREAQFSRSMLARLDALNIAELPHEQWLLAKMLRHTFASGAESDNSGVAQKVIP